MNADSMTQGKQSVEGLKLRKAQYKSVFETVSDAILILDCEGVVKDANPAAVEMYGYAREELVGIPAKRLFQLRDSYKFDLSLDRAKRLQRESKFKAAHVTKSGETLHALVQAKVSHHRPGLNLFIKDNTQREHTEQRLRAAKVQAEASDIAKSQFLANVSHEIRTPMNVILGYAGLLKDSELDEQMRNDFVDSILKNGDSLVKLIDRILDISKVEVGSLNIERETFPLYPAVKDVINQLERQFSGKGIKFVLEFKLGLDRQIKTDPLRFRQVLLNLLNNAVKFTFEGTVTLLVEQGLDERLTFQVQDTGIGIPKEQWKKLFNPFTQVDASATRDCGGSGLGLAISKHLAQALGGNLFLKKSLMGKGSVFEFWIKSGVPAHNLAETVSEQKTSKPSFETLKNAKILLVEDMKENQALIKMYLREIDCKLDIASDGKEALDKLSRHSYDLILMDLQMPRLDGFGATHLIRQKGLKTPIIALTAHAMKEDVEKCMRSGFDAHLSKPIRSKELLSKMSKHRWGAVS